MNEHGFVKSITRKLPKEIYVWKIQAMMNNGLPDLYFSGIAGDLWLEVKFIKLPKRDTTLIKPGLSELQLNWLTKRYKEGRSVALLIGSDEGCYVQQHPSFDKPINKHTFKSTRQQIVEWIISQTNG